MVSLHPIFPGGLSAPDAEPPPIAELVAWLGRVWRRLVRKITTDF